MSAATEDLELKQRFQPQFYADFMSNSILFTFLTPVVIAFFIIKWIKAVQGYIK